MNAITALRAAALLTGNAKNTRTMHRLLSDYPTKGVGLLFMRFQAGIQDQFAFMQNAWANNSNFVKGETGLDPIIGQGAGNDQKWRQHYGQPADEEIEFSFQGFVEMKGGEFFFAPSIKFLKTFAPPAAQSNSGLNVLMRTYYVDSL